MLVPGFSGNALKLEAGKGRVELPALALGQAFTLSAFIRPDRVDDQMQAWLSLESHGRQAVLSVSGYLQFRVNGDAARTVVKLPAGEWSHVTGTFDGLAAKVYLDGVNIYPPVGATHFGHGLIWSVRRRAPPTARNAVRWRR